MDPSKAIPSEVHLSESVKVNPHKMDLLDSRMSGGRNGVRSSFSPLRSTSVISPSLHLDSVSRLSGFAREESGELGSNPLSGEVAASDGFSQSSCKTLKCANQALKEHVALPTHAVDTKETEKAQTKSDVIKPLVCTPQQQGKPTHSGSKKKSTPNKRPASAISIGTTYGTEKNMSPNNKIKKSLAAEQNSPKSPKSQPMEKSSQPPTQQISETSRDAVTCKSDTAAQNAASRDTLLDYHFSTTSNPARTTTSGSRMANSPPAPPSKAAAVSVAPKPAGQKKLDMFLLRSRPKNKNGVKLQDKSAEKEEEHGKVHAIAKANEHKQTPHEQSLSSAVSEAIHSEATNSTHLQIAHLREKISNLQKQLDEATSQNKAIKNNQTMVTLQLQATLKNRTAQLEELKQDSNARMTKAMNVIEHLVREESLRKAQELRQKLASDGARLGRLVASRVHGGMRSHPIESWEDGNQPKLLKLRRGDLRKKR
ncbi:hypothetical protein ACHAW6_012362 [Cyclotella cf. meneghiniana]